MSGTVDPGHDRAAIEDILHGCVRHAGLRDRYWASHQDPRYSTPVRY